MAIGNSLRWTVAVAGGVILGASLVGVLRGQDPTPKPADPQKEAAAKEEKLVKSYVEEVEKFNAAQKAAQHAPSLDIDDVELRKRLEASLPKIGSIQPLPAFEIPDDPPPHEGAMIEIPYVLQPPDMINVEVLEALPGRPITGERLVRQDGTITLGFYGSLKVSGLTMEQTKTKIVLHLRKYLEDDVIGLIGIAVDADDEAVPVNAPPPPALPPVPNELPPLPEDRDVLPPEEKPPTATPKARVSLPRRDRGRVGVRLVATTQQKAPGPLKAPQTTVRNGASATDHARPDPVKEAVAKDVELPDIPFEAPQGGPSIRQQAIIIAPVDSDRVFVNVVSYNSTVYYVDGDVVQSGRFPVTGHETVIDAIHNAGGLVPTADEKSIRLVRPGRNGKPSKIYPIDLAAIRDLGETKANLQLFPGDRLVVGRKTVVASTVRFNEMVARSATAMNSLMYYAYAMRAVNNIGEPFNPNAPLNARIKVGGFNLNMNLGPDGPPNDLAKRREALKAWAEMISDDPKVREEILKLVK